MQKFRRAYEAAGFTEAAVEADLIRAFPKAKNQEKRRREIKTIIVNIKSRGDKL